MAKKLNGEATPFIGLWETGKKDCYRSAVMNLSQLKQFKGNVSLFLMKNKYWEKGSVKPKFVFKITDASNYDRDINEMDFAQAETETVISLEDARSFARECVDDLYNGESYDDILPEFRYVDGRKYEIPDEILERYVC